MIFFFNDTATTEIYTLSLHDALPIFRDAGQGGVPPPPTRALALEHPADDSRPSVIASSDGTCSSAAAPGIASAANADRKSTRLNSSHANISYVVFCLKKKTHPCTPLV